MRRMNVPRLLAEFFIEAFAVDGPEVFRHCAHKHFPKPVVLPVCFPERIPMSFSSPEPQKIQIGFFESPRESSVDLERRVGAALNAMARRNLLIAEFRRVDTQNFPDAAITAVARRFGLPLLRLDQERDEGMQTKNVVVRIMIVEALWTQDVDAEIRKACTQAFVQGKVAYCSVCGLVFSAPDAAQCKVRLHPGKRIPFEGGAWEEQDIVGGDRVTYGNFTCCGRGIVGDGCQVHVTPEHRADTERSLSELLFDVIPLFPPSPRYE
jgi:hypothetical protein